jgi:hypothetical protein
VALAAFAEGSFRPRVRRFLSGLSFDELEFIAGFLGSCVLESPRSTAQLAARFVGLEQVRLESFPPLCEDVQHKMILLLEFLGQGGFGRPSAPVAHAGHA